MITRTQQQIIQAMMEGFRLSRYSLDAYGWVVKGNDTRRVRVKSIRGLEDLGMIVEDSKESFYRAGTGSDLVYRLNAPVCPDCHGGGKVQEGGTFSAFVRCGKCNGTGRLLLLTEAEAIHSKAGELCGVCDETGAHEHPRSRCVFCGQIGLANEMKRHKCKGNEE